jgi:OmpA-OmpF porin, OOP family
MSLSLLVIGITLLSTLSAQTVKVQGVIKARSGATMILQTADSPALPVLLTDTTKVGQIQGVFKGRTKQMGMTALTPGLAVQVEAVYNEHNQLAAKSVRFHGDDLKSAQRIQAGLSETRVQTQKNKEELEKHQQELDRQSAALKAQSDALKQQQEQMAAHQEKITANQAALDAAIARFGQLDDYYILDEVTVHFGNSKSAVDPQYRPRLMQLAENAKKIQGYMIEVKGYASSVGSAELNQRLSADRATNVVNLLVQQGHIPLTNMLAPAAMGESQQTGIGKTAAGQAENRRVVVRVLQNKGIAGLAAAAGADSTISKRENK